MESWEFGTTLRHRRDHVAPEAVGVPAGARRRAAGLRREELAALAGISADYLTRLEQGRATTPSAQVVEALARALRLPDRDRELFFRLAGHAAPGPEVVPQRIVPSVQRLLDRLDGTPVAVYDAAGWLLDANAPFDALMGPTAALRGLDRNAVWRNLVGPRSRTVHTEQEHAALVAGQVADLRRTASRYPRDHGLQRLVDAMRRAAPDFDRLWDGSGSDLGHEPSRHKVVEHPTVGRIAVDCDVLLVGTDDLRIMVYTAAPGTDDAERLALAVVLGTQSLTGEGTPAVPLPRRS